MLLQVLKKILMFFVVFGFELGIILFLCLFLVQLALFIFHWWLMVSCSLSQNNNPVTWIQRQPGQTFFFFFLLCGTTMNDGRTGSFGWASATTRKKNVKKMFNLYPFCLFARPRFRYYLLHHHQPWRHEASQASYDEPHGSSPASLSTYWPTIQRCRCYAL